MKVWYKAVCDEHKECCGVMVSNPTATAAYLGEHSKQIQGWLEKHYGCKLRIVHLDPDMDFLYENDYTFADDPWRRPWKASPLPEEPE